MSTSPWPRLRSLFARALELPEAEREAFLEAVEDPDLRRELGELLAAADAAAGFLERPAALTAPSLDRDLSGQLLGGFRLQRKIGEGGMSVVYEAARASGSFRQRVAVKLLKRGMDQESWRRRFAAERQILANLAHPSIARLLDGGSTADGLPYAVMELVEGEPIDEWCRRRRLSVEGRLELFVQVCRAVSFAHRNLVVHRDLKPANILICEDGSPKLLDFGIAKLLAPVAEAGDAEDGGGTVTGMRVLTPGYASPEQVRGEPITTASDVYSLGVLLYRLLCGSPPLDLAGLSLPQLERRMGSVSPPPPSLRSQGASAAGLPLRPEALHRRLRGDLDAILLKALRPDPQHRYGSVDGLLDDLEHHRRGRPVGARKGTFAYRAGKLLRRHLGAALAIGGAAIALLALAAVSMAQAERVARERDTAHLEREQKQEVLSFLLELFEEADPERNLGAAVTVEDVLERGEARLRHQVEQRPQLQATLLGALARVHHQLGRYPASLALRRREIALRRQADGPPTELIEGLNGLGHTLLLAGRLAAARAAYREALARGRQDLGPGHAEVADSLFGLGLVRFRSGDPAAGAALLGEAVERLRDARPGRSSRLSDALFNQALAVRSAGDGERAEALLRETLVLERARWGEDPHPRIAGTLRELSSLLAERGAYEKAQALGEEALAVLRRTLPPEHPKIAYSLAQLGSLARTRERLELAEAYYREALAFRTAPFAEDGPDRASLLNNLGTVLRQQRRYAAAEDFTRQAVSIYRRHYGEAHPDVVAALSNLGLCRALQADHAAAAELYRQALEMGRRVLGPRHPALAFTLMRWGELELEDQRPGRASTLLAEALSLRREALSPHHPLIAQAASALGACRAREGRWREAEELLLESANILERVHGRDHPAAAEARRRLEELDEERPSAEKATAKAGGREAPATNPREIPASGALRD